MPKEWLRPLPIQRNGRRKLLWEKDDKNVNTPFSNKNILGGITRIIRRVRISITSALTKIESRSYLRFVRRGSVYCQPMASQNLLKLPVIQNSSTTLHSVIKVFFVFQCYKP